MTRLVFLSALAFLVAGASARAEEASKQPFELVRALQHSQDAIAQGDTAAHLSQRDRLAQIGDVLARAEGATWKDARNVRAVITFALSGGNFSLLQKVVAHIPPELNDQMLKAAMAYAQGQNAAAARLFDKIDARTLPPSLAGHVALVQSELIAKSAPAKALVLLDEARLLAPGTLIEEAALRRQAAIAAAQGKLDDFKRLATHYFYRFPKSVYAAAFRHEFAATVAADDHAEGKEQLAGLAAALSALAPGEQRKMNLEIAREALLRGKVVLARSAAGNAAGVGAAADGDRVRAQIYEAAATVASLDAERAAGSLAGIATESLDQEESELVTAARMVLAAVRHAPPQPSLSAPQAIVDETAKDYAAFGHAREALARVDQLLAEAKK